MRLVAIFKDATGAEWFRERHSAEHLGFLEKNKDKIAIGGLLRQDAAATPYGGLWVLSVSSKEEAIDLIPTIASGSEPNTNCFCGESLNSLALWNFKLLLMAR